MRSAAHVDRELILDATAVVLGSVAICLFAHRLWIMTLGIPVLLLSRLVVWGALRGATARSFAREALFFAVCILIGGFNDYNSVVRHGIYDYDTPLFFPTLTTIPLWMLLFWGMILRFLTTLTASPWLGATGPPMNLVHIGPRVVHSAGLKIALLLGLVAVTRQCIYRLYLDPWWSWIPFALAFVAYWALFGPKRHDVVLVATALVGGPLIEILYIQLAHLHHYHLGWFFGVPLWIVLWWAIALLVWKDLGYRLRGWIDRLIPPRRRRKDMAA